MTFLHSLSEEDRPIILSSTAVNEGGKRWLFFYMVRSEDLQSVVMRNIPAQGRWTVDVLRSPVIELSRSFFDGEILRRGRLYVVDGFFDSNERWVEKGDSFRQWAGLILSATRKRLTKYKTDYIGPSARRWLDSGGKLVA
jgi:hypothetical protein